MSIENEGSITFWLNHQNQYWYKDNNHYNFHNVSGNGIEVKAKKIPPNTISIKIDGPFDKTFNFNEIIPDCDSRGLFVVLSWKNSRINIYLNGDLISLIDETT